MASDDALECLSEIHQFVSRMIRLISFSRLYRGDHYVSPAVQSLVMSSLNAHNTLRWQRETITVFVEIYYHLEPEPVHEQLLERWTIKWSPETTSPSNDILTSLSRVKLWKPTSVDKTTAAPALSVLAMNAVQDFNLVSLTMPSHKVAIGNLPGRLSYKVLEQAHNVFAVNTYVKRQVFMNADISNPKGHLSLKVEYVPTIPKILSPVLVIPQAIPDTHLGDLQQTYFGRESVVLPIPRPSSSPIDCRRHSSTDYDAGHSSHSPPEYSPRGQAFYRKLSTFFSAKTLTSKSVPLPERNDTSSRVRKTSSLPEHFILVTDRVSLQPPMFVGMDNDNVSADITKDTEATQDTKTTLNQHRDGVSSDGEPSSFELGEESGSDDDDVTDFFMSATEGL